MPRAKRSKQYRKLMEQFSMGFGYRVPYQVLVDADFIAEANKCKMDLVRRLEDTLHGEVKPMITQCSMRHLYERKSEPGVEAAIEQAKTQFERRRCGHHPDEYPEPLSALECIQSVVDPKDNSLNKHRYVCAINDDAVRASIRQIAGTPLLFIRRSVMIMEPMATVSAKIRSKDEKSKFRAELKTVVGGKRKREDDSDDSDQDGNEKQGTGKSDEPEKLEEKKKSKKRKRGRKEPNPLAVKKKQPKPASDGQHSKAPEANEAGANEADAAETGQAEAPKRKRRRRRGRGANKAGGDATTEEATVTPNTANSTGEAPAVVSNTANAEE
ncbi:uncharacterized protein GGS22DRAFT_168968 [Annulohypoxylon maeteangense]|uniref:uncharacterized protein n=1 Tax=Annulohypoxylon maeteangense TaxID=1927788 RepID=UPI0020086092|nr:uncharacterized protein GGS22DRAFT_168968 [Annulohypoxylon maeteangense]KAI0882861.1 hypothetical protein GGS22DRAFT_168968 [Annulohypoxylon maeteangense]